MAGSTYGTLFKITTWGESHGPAVGVVIDGCPSGLPLREEDIQKFLDRRKPGQSRYTTKRKEEDRVEILSGVFDGRTTGAPLSLLIRNEDQRSKDYGALKDCYRPGHADYTFDQKYGFRDYRGGGRSSGRETIGRVAAGAVAAKILSQIGVAVTAYTKAIGDIVVPESEYDYAAISCNKLYMPSQSRAEQASAYLESCMENRDSSGGIVECIVTGVPVGIGEPVFDKLDANLAKAVMSIGAVKGVEIGDGFASASSRGSTNNDSFHPASKLPEYGDKPQKSSLCGSIGKTTNHAGGILGGISDGSPIILRAAIKPTPSIASPQKTVDKNGNPVNLTIHGRHDPVIVPRAVVVVESMVALTLVDLIMINMSVKLENIINFYQ